MRRKHKRPKVGNSHAPVCHACRRGVVQPAGYALDGRLQYGCSFCSHSYTNGYGGEPWDPRSRL